MTSVSDLSYLDRLRATMARLTETTPTFKAMLYGMSGVGKTVASLQIAQVITSDYKRILYIDTAEGWVSLLNHPDLITDRVDRMNYINLGQIEALCNAIRTGAEEFGQIGCIILDEASSAADTALDDVVKMRATQDRGKDPDTPTQPDYNTTTNRVRKAFFDLITLPGVHLILVSHVRKDKDNRNVEVTSASFLPKLGQKIKQPLHMIAHMSGNEIGEDQYVRVYQVHPTRTIDAKSRIGGLKPQVEYDELITKIGAWLKGRVPTVEDNGLVPDRDPELIGQPHELVLLEGE